ncbi:MAG: GtrA family protein [Colwellia sp.]|jgi:Predicted membrane protein
MISYDNCALKQELLRFLVTGILAVGIDFSSYWLLIDVIPTDVAKGLSFILGSMVAFIMNKLWTFEDETQLGNAAFQFACLYSLTFLVNVAVNHLILAYAIEMKLLAFLFATATSTVLNFLGMKFWVFRQDLSN